MADLPAWVAFGTSVVTGLAQVATTKISTAARTAVAEVESRLASQIAAAQKRADDAVASVEALKQTLKTEEIVRTAARSQTTQPTLPDADDLGAMLGVDDIRRRLLQLEDGERARQADATRLAGEIGRLIGRIEAMPMVGGSRR